jgi:hypothetical protein
MGRIVRSIALNPVEPSLLSFRVPYGMQTTLDITMSDASGNVLTFDVAGQLQIIGRSDGRTTSYAAPATDIVNGKSRVTFPAGAFSDRNGYRLRLFGTIKGEAELLATGEVRVTATMGPEAMPSDIIDTIPLVFTLGQDALLDVTLWLDEGKGAPYDLSIVTVNASVYPERYSMLGIIAFTQAQTGPNSLRLSLTAAEVNALPTSCWWSLRVSSAGQLKTLAEGPVSVVSAPTALSAPLEAIP